MEIRDRDFEEEVLKTDKLVVVDFWGSWCIPCKQMEPVIEKLEKDYSGRIKFCSMNINRNPRIPDEYSIKGVPTYTIFWKGEIIKRDVGAKSENQLRNFINEILEEINKS